MRMSHLKKPLAFLFATVMLFTAAACDSGNASDSESSSTQPSSIDSSKDSSSDDFITYLSDETPTSQKENSSGVTSYSAPQKSTSKRRKAVSTRGYSYYPQITNTMPAIHIDTADKSTSFATDYGRNEKINGEIEYVGAKISVKEAEKAYLMSNVDAQVKVRGNYTLDSEKKSIRIKFDKKQGMLGVNGGKKYKNWVLLADFKDLSLSHNTIAYYLGNTLLGSDGYYCSDFRSTEVYINGEYWGVYLLCEQQEVNDGRIAVSEVEKGYTGTDIGYFFEYDVYCKEEDEMPDGMGDPTFRLNYSGGGYYQKGYTVKSDINSPNQLNFLQKYMESAFKVAYEAVKHGKFYRLNSSYNGVVASNNTSVQAAVESVFNVDSFVDMYIISEIMRDPDIAQTSFFLSVDMSKTGNKKITLQAPWDFDSALGIKNDDASNTWDYYAKDSANPWLSLLANEPWFVNKVKAKWKTMKEKGVLETALYLVDDQKDAYASYYKRNYERWSSRIGWGGGVLRDEVVAFRTQAQAADYLHRWLEDRFDWLDSVWG